ncbi:MAG: serine hydrolase [Bacteroidota bacterium]
MKRSLIMFLWLVSPAMTHAQQDLDSSIRSLTEGSGAVFGIAMVDLGTGRQFFWKEREMFHAASTMKTPVMMEVFRQAREGLFNLDDSILVTNEFRSIVDSSVYSMDLKDDSDDSMYGILGKKTTIRHLVEQMITVSSNLATNILIELVGADKTTATMRRLGAPDIQILRGVEDGKAFEKGLNNTTNAVDLMTIFAALAEGKAVSEQDDSAMVEVLLRQQFRDKIPALLPPDVRVAHKTGNITGVEHDSGILLLPDGSRMVMVILTRGWQDQRQAKGLMAQVARKMFDAFSEGN